jgi:hypothetical protein
MNYQEIQNLFGTPLQHVPKPKLPYKLKTSHVLFGGVALTLMVLGVIKAREYITYYFSNDSKKVRY